MKSLLISLMAFLCALGVSATPTGTGTQEDPYVIADGDIYMVDDPVYASFTAPGDGTLTLSYNLMKDPAFTVVAVMLCRLHGVWVLQVLLLWRLNLVKPM